jgi:hypothetical protein
VRGDACDGVVERRHRGIFVLDGHRRLSLLFFLQHGFAASLALGEDLAAHVVGG